MEYVMKICAGFVFLVCSFMSVQASQHTLSFVIEEVQDLTPNKSLTASQSNLTLTLAENDRFVQFLSTWDESVVVPHRTYFMIDKKADLTYRSRKQNPGPFGLLVGVESMLYSVPFTLTPEDLKAKELRFSLLIKRNDVLDPTSLRAGDYLFELRRIFVQGS